MKGRTGIGFVRRQAGGGPGVGWCTVDLGRRIYYADWGLSRCVCRVASSGSQRAAQRCTVETCEILVDNVGGCAPRRHPGLLCRGHYLLLRPTVQRLSVCRRHPAVDPTACWRVICQPSCGSAGLRFRAILGHGDARCRTSCCAEESDIERAQDAAARKRPTAPSLLAT